MNSQTLDGLSALVMTEASIVLIFASCGVFRDPRGPIVTDWSPANQAGNSTENQHGFFQESDSGTD